MRSKLERLIPENWSHWLVIATGTFFFLFVLVEFTVSIALYSLASPSPFMYYFTPAGVLLGETLISFYATTALIAGFFIVLRWKVYVKEEGSLKFKRENSRLLLPFYLTAFISLGLYISMIPLSLSNLLTYAVFILLAASFAEHFQVSDYEGMIREYLPQMEKATELVTCPECGFKEAAGAKICSQCGTALRKTRERKVLRSKREEEEELEAEEMIEELEREVETKETMEELEKEVKEMIDGLEKEAETKETMEELEREVEGMIEKLEREVEEPEAEKMLEELESKVEEVWECPICGAEAAIDAEACSVCGEPLNEEEMLKELKGEVEEMMEGLEGTAEEVRECPICGAEVAVDSEVCPLCDEPLKEEEMIEEEVEAEEMMEELEREMETAEEVQECPICGAEAAIDAEVCPVCGEPLEEKEPREEEMMEELEKEVEEIEAKTEETLEEEPRLTNLDAVDESTAEKLRKQGIKNLEDVVEKGMAGLAEIPDMGFKDAKEILDEAKLLAEKKECPICAAVIPRDSKKCPECGEPLEKEQVEDQELIDELKEFEEELEEEPEQNELLEELEELERSKEEEPSKEAAIRELKKLRGVGTSKAKALYEHGYKSIEDLKDVSEKELRKVKGIGSTFSKRILESLKDLKK